MERAKYEERMYTRRISVALCILAHLCARKGRKCDPPSVTPCPFRAKMVIINNGETQTKEDT